MIKRLFYILKQRLYLFKNRNTENQGKIYMFHEIEDIDDTYAISKDNFIELINNKRIVDIETLIKEKNKDNIVITFDDAYASVYNNLFPILKEKKIPYYIFICEEYLNKDKYLNEDMIKEMLKDSNCILGSHNLKHELSRFVDEETLKNNLIKSKKDLEAIFNVKINTFAFPYGSMYAVSDNNIELAKKIYDYIFMTYPLPYNQANENIIPRININNNNYKGELP